MPQVAFAVAGIASAVGSAVAGSAILQSVVSLGVSLGLTILGRALAPKPELNQVTGLRSDVTSTGGTQPQAFILGRYATAGHHVAPPMSSLDSNSDLTYVIEVSDIPGCRLRRVVVDGEYSDIDGGDATAPADATEGRALLGLRRGGTDYAWVRFHNGTQTAADQFLLGRYSTAAQRPWSSNHIGTGISYAVLTFRYNQELFSGLPAMRLELDGIPLYDPRRDTTAGGSGTHRFNDQSTWEFSENPAVMIYNLMRGIVLPDGSVYGGETAAGNLPFGNWIAAMNACDVQVGGRSQFVAGFEVKTTDEPAAVIEELLKSCIGQMSEQGGVWRIRVGGPAVPVYAFTDGDVIISEDRTFNLHPGLADIHNGVTVNYPEPANLWEARETQPILSAALETEDGGRRLVTNLNLPAVRVENQARQIGQGLINDNRRFRTATLSLPPDAWVVEPLDTVSWTSARNGWTNKPWEVLSVHDDPVSMTQTVTLREREPADYDWSASNEIPAPLPSAGIILPPAQALDAWAVAAGSISDGANPRRPALTLSWSGSRAQEAEFVLWQVRRSGTTQVVASGTADTAQGRVTVTEGILGNTTYDARGQYVMARPTQWSGWLSATTPQVYFGSLDLDPQILANIAAAQGQSTAAQQAVTTLETQVTGRLTTIETGIPELASITYVDQQVATIGDVATITDTVNATRQLLAEDVASAERQFIDLLRSDNQKIADRTANAAGRTQLRASVDGQFAAEASLRQELEATVVNVRADLTTEQQVRATADTALSFSVTQLQAAVGTNTAGITSLEATRVTAAGAIAAVTGQVSASFGTLSALASAASSAEATAAEVRARTFISVNTNDLNAASLELIAHNTPQGQGTVVALRGDLILLDGTVTSAKIVSVDAGTIITGSLDTRRLLLDGQYVEADSNGRLRIRQLGVTRDRLANDAVTDTIVSVDNNSFIPPSSSSPTFATSSAVIVLNGTADDDVIQVGFSAEIEGFVDVVPAYGIISNPGDPLFYTNPLQPVSTFGLGVGNGFRKWVAGGICSGGVHEVRIFIQYRSASGTAGNVIRNFRITAKIARK